MGLLFSSLWSLFWPEKKRKVIIMGASPLDKAPPKELHVGVAAVDAGEKCVTSAALQQLCMFPRHACT